METGGKNAAVYNAACKTAMLTATDEESGRKLAGLLSPEAELILVSQPFMEDILEEKQYSPSLRCIQVLYTRKTVLPVKHKDIRRLGMESYEYVCAHYCDQEDYGENLGEDRDRRYIQERILSGVMYGAYVGEKLVGFAGFHGSGGLGMLYVEEDSCRQGIGASLESYIINRMLERNWTPYGHVAVENETSLRLQEKLGLYLAPKTFCWMEKSACK